MKEVSVRLDIDETERTVMEDALSKMDFISFSSYITVCMRDGDIRITKMRKPFRRFMQLMKIHVWKNLHLDSMYGFVQFRKSCKKEMEGLKKIMPYCFEMHGKCHYVDENLHEVSIPYEDIIPVIADSEYNGYIVTEYEDEGGYNAVEQTTRHVAMVKKLLGNKS